MSKFRAVAVFECKNSNVYSEMCKSIAYVQTIYCFPMPSEYFESMKFDLSEDESYLEQEFIFPSEEKYKEWFQIFGEVIEELVLEMEVEFEHFGITYRRFFDDVNLANVRKAEPIENFQSRFNDTYKSKQMDL